MIKHETVLTARQEILKHACPFTVHTLRSLLYDLGHLGHLGHMFIEYLYVLARDDLKHSREAGTFPERITKPVLHARAVRSFISLFDRVEREEE